MNPLVPVALRDIALEPGSSLALLLPLRAPGAAAADTARRDATRQMLRAVLGILLGRAPGSLRFDRSAQGKPRLMDGGNIAFNLSHARSHSLIALSRSGDVGCDIEDRFTDEEVAGLCPLILHPSEFAAMEGLGAQERVEAFRRYWVRKEAVLKAAGCGFLADPRQLVAGQEQPYVAWHGPAAATFAVHNRRITAGCLAAVASVDPVCTWRVLAP